MKWAYRFSARQREEYWRKQYYVLELRVNRALSELGVPGPGYAAPVANAVNILRYGHPDPDAAGAELSDSQADVE